MIKHELLAEGLYVLSAPQAAGKSTLADQLRRQVPNSVVSRDEIRERLFGVGHLSSGKEFLYGWHMGEGFTNGVLHQTIAARMSQRLPTLVDATFLVESERSELAYIAKQYGMPFEVLFLEADEETCIARNASRRLPVPASVIKESFVNWQRTTVYPSRQIARDDQLEFVPLKMGLDTDVVGDVHGLLEDLKILLNDAGYVLDKQGVPHHPEGRRLLFDGDVVDRGPESIPLLQFVHQAVRSGGHVLLRGNHENKLLRNLAFYYNKQELPMTAMAPMQTFKDFLRLSKEEQQELFQFLLYTPAKVVIDALPLPVAVVHANIGEFNPVNMPSELAFYGQERISKDTDKLWNERVERGDLGFLLVRGHIEATGVAQQAVQVLEARQVYGGELRLLPIDRWLVTAANLPLKAEGSIIDRDYLTAARQVTLARKCDYDFGAKMADRVELIKGLARLLDEKLVSAKKVGELSIYRYKQSVFWDNLWNKDPLLKKARGIVIDQTNQIVAHPFDKVFNWGEGDTGLDLPSTMPVVVVNKLNGFLGVMSAYEYAPNSVLYSTTGSLNSPFVDLLRLASERELNQEKLGVFLKERNLSLMFEVLDRSDPHIIQIDPKDYGLWLIGARSTLAADSPLLKEEELDALAFELGVRRPDHKKMTIGELKKMAEGQEIEGWLVRRDDEGQEPLFKIKTTYYLTVKFLGRMKDDKWKLLYANPRVFMQRVDEEFYPLVASIPAAIKLEDLLAMSKENRIDLVRDIINTSRLAKPGELPDVKPVVQQSSPKNTRLQRIKI